MTEPGPGGTIQEILRRSEKLDHGLFAVGIEIVPFGLTGVITDVDGGELAVYRSGLPEMHVDTVVEHVATFAQDLVNTSLGLSLRNSRICLGVQLGGPVEPDTGVVRFYSNGPDDHGRERAPYEWSNVALADRLRAATGCATIVDNDAHAYAAYEQKFGVGHQTGSFAIILIRDGVGAGVVIDGTQLQIPMEFGHLLVWPEGRICDCGNRGCIESQAGRRAISAMVRELTRRDGVLDFEAAVALANGLSDAAADAQHAFRRAGVSIARGLATMLTLFGLDQVVIYCPEDLIRKDTAAARCFGEELVRFRDYAFKVTRTCELVLRPLDHYRGAHGAALIALNRQFFIPLRPRSEHRR